MTKVTLLKKKEYLIITITAFQSFSFIYYNIYNGFSSSKGHYNWWLYFWECVRFQMKCFPFYPLFNKWLVPFSKKLYVFFPFPSLKREMHSGNSIQALCSGAECHTRQKIILACVPKDILFHISWYKRRKIEMKNVKVCIKSVLHCILYHKCLFGYFFRHLGLDTLKISKQAKKKWKIF